MNIAVFDVEEWEREAFRGLEDDNNVTFVAEELNNDNIDQYKDAQIISVFIYSELDSDILSQFSDLKYITTRSTGYDHIDIDYCQKNKIVLSNVPEYGDNTVAEHVFGLLLLISHRLMDAVQRTCRGDFTQKGLRGFGFVLNCVYKVEEQFFSRQRKRDENDQRVPEQLCRRQPRQHDRLHEQP